MSTVESPKSHFWSRHFTNLAAESRRSGTKQLDFSNGAVAVQTYAFVLEACANLHGKHVLDCGFGTGELSRMFDLLGGAVDAVDVVSTRIPQLREETPSVFWSAADIASWKLPQNSDPYDVIVACEVLQYVDFGRVVANLVEALTDDGRLVIMIPNADCPIVQRVATRFNNQYVGISAASLPQRFAPYTSTCHIGYRGIAFQDDQRLVPYTAGPWITIDGCQARSHESRVAGGPDSVPNRLQIVVAKVSQ